MHNDWKTLRSNARTEDNMPNVENFSARNVCFMPNLAASRVELVRFGEYPPPETTRACIITCGPLQRANIYNQYLLFVLVLSTVNSAINCGIHRWFIEWCYRAAQWKPAPMLTFRISYILLITRQRMQIY